MLSLLWAASPSSGSRDTSTRVYPCRSGESEEGNGYRPCPDESSTPKDSIRCPSLVSSHSSRKASGGSAELTETWEVGGATLLVRPIRPEDAEAHAALFARLTPEDIRFRFFSTLRALSAEQVARMTQVDYDREMAFVAVDEASGDTVGVCRLVREPYTDVGEFAVVVEGRMKGRGLARRLMRKLIDWARARGMTTITGQVLAENQPMLAFVRKLGFAVRRLPDEPEVMEVTLGLAAPPGGG